MMALSSNPLLDYAPDLRRLAALIVVNKALTV